MSELGALPLRTLEIIGPAISLLRGCPALEATRLSGHEGLNSLFDLDLFLKTPDWLNLGANKAMNFDHDVPVAQDRMESDSAKALHAEHHLSNQGYRADGESTSQRKAHKERGSVAKKDSSQ